MYLTCVFDACLCFARAVCAQLDPRAGFAPNINKHSMRGCNKASKKQAGRRSLSSGRQRDTHEERNLRNDRRRDQKCQVPDRPIVRGLIVVAMNSEQSASTQAFLVRVGAAFSALLRRSARSSFDHRTEARKFSTLIDGSA